MLKTGRALRNLGKRDMYRVLRWGPMAVADLVAEYFETELLRAVIAARGVFGTFLPVVCRECTAIADSRRRRSSSGGLCIFRCRWNGRTHASYGFRR